MEKSLIKTHSLRYEGSKIYIKGVEKIESFDPKEAIILLSEQNLYLKGNNFVLIDTDTNNGICTISGKLSSATYLKTMEKISLLKRIFK